MSEATSPGDDGPQTGGDIRPDYGERGLEHQVAIQDDRLGIDCPGTWMSKQGSLRDPILFRAPKRSPKSPEFDGIGKGLRCARRLLASG